jgi:YjbE family integral membrane protein
MKGEALDFLWQDVSHAPFWIGVFQIIGVNVILSGDNAVVIALACMTLPPRQRLWGMILGAGVAVLLRVAFTVVVAQAMTYPYLRLIGGLLLFWVAIKLVVEDESGADGRVESARTLWRAVRIVAIADIVMSLDNVIAIAAAAETAAESVDLMHAEEMKVALIVFGLATSVPLIVAGSAMLMALLERFLILIWAGGALLGWIAGDILSTDPALLGFLGETATHLHLWAGRAGALIVVGLGLIVVGRKRRLTVEDVLAGVSLVIWLGADVGIEHLIADTAVAMRWLVRGAVATLLAVGYKALRSRRRLGGEEV